MTNLFRREVKEMKQEELNNLFEDNLGDIRDYQLFIANCNDTIVKCNEKLEDENLSTEEVNELRCKVERNNREIQKWEKAIKYAEEQNEVIVAETTKRQEDDVIVATKSILAIGLDEETKAKIVKMLQFNCDHTSTYALKIESQMCVKGYEPDGYYITLKGTRCSLSFYVRFKLDGTTFKFERIRKPRNLQVKLEAEDYRQDESYWQKLVQTW